MSGQLPMFSPTTCEDSSSATSSPALAFGLTPCDSPDGPTIGSAGPEAAPAQVSQRQVKVKGLMTLVTSGLIGYDSPESVALQSSLESRLLPRLDTAGSTLFKLTWKRRTTPLGRRYLERAASVLRTSGKGCTSSVPTPNTPSGGPNSKSTATHMGGMDLDGVATLAAVPSPATPSGGRTCSGMDATGRTVDGRKHTASLEHTVKFATVATPRANDATPSARDWKDTGDLSQSMTRKDGKSRLDVLPRQAMQHEVSGPTATGGTDATASTGQLNAAYSRWLQGLPVIFDYCAMAVKSQKRRKRESSD
jgi:hypothetical protein